MLVGGIGLLPHLAFSREVGTVAFFKDAWDEEFYALQAVWSWPANVDRFLSGALLRLVYVAVGCSIERTLILSDFVLPFAASLAASYFARAVAARPLVRVGLVLSLLLATDVLSLGSQAIWGPTLSVRTAFEEWPGLARLPRPASSTSFLMVYRTPEPVTGWAYAFVVLGCVLRHVTAGTGTVPGRRVVALFLLAALLPFIYVFVSIPLLVFQAGLALLLLVTGARSRVLPPLGAAAVGVVILGLALGWTSSADVAAVSTFPSRLPVVSPAVLLSAGLCLGLVTLRHRRLFGSPREMTALASAAVPLVVNLQQTATGVMVGPKVWENYSDYVFLAAAVAAIVPWDGPRAQRLCPPWSGAAWVLALLALLGVGRARTYDMFHSVNATSVAQARALARTDPGSARVLLENPDDGDLLAVRLGQPFPTTRSYRDVMVSGQRIANMPPGGGPPPGRALHQRRAFEHYARTGVEPARLAAELEADIAAGRSGRHLLWFFSVRDATPGFSGSRAVRREAMRQQVGDIVKAYRAYLDRSPSEWRDAVLYVTTKSPLHMALNPGFHHQTLSHASTGAASTRAYVYRQTLRSGPRPDPKEAVRDWIAEWGQPLQIVPSSSGARLEPEVVGVGGVAPAGQLPASTWVPAVPHGMRAEQRADGLFLVTLDRRHAYALAGPVMSVPVGGRYAFVLTARVLDGGMAFGALSADRSRWLAQVGPTARAADGDGLWILELELRAGERFVLLVTNDHPTGDHPSTFVIRAVQAVRYARGLG